MACGIKPYIKSLTSNIEAQEELNKIHNNIFKEIYDSKLFRLFKDRLYEKTTSSESINRGRALIKAINDKYNTLVTKVQTSNTSVPYVIVNVQNLTNSIEGAISRVNQESSMGIDRFGDNIYLQNSTTIPTEVNENTLNIVKEAIKRLNIQVEEIGGIEGRKLGVNGFADLFSNLIKYVGTEEATVLPEETMHIVVGLLKQKNNSLYKSFLSDITSYNLYQQVFQQYKNIYIKEGKPNVIKIKEEAIAKLLVEMLIKENNELAENSEKLSKTKSLWNSFKDWFQKFLNKLGVNYFDSIINPIKSSSATDILNNDYSNVIITDNNSIFYQISDKSNEIYNSLVDRSSKIEKKYSQEDETEKFYFDNNKMKNKVSDIVAKINKNFIQEDDKRQSSNDKIHADLQDIFYRLVDKRTGLKKNIPEKPGTISQAFPNNIEYYNVFYNYMNDLVNSYPQNTKFLSEINVVNEDSSIGGTVDFIAILPDGYIDILDWGMININPAKSNDVSYKTARNINIELNKYINDILKKKYNVSNIRYSRAIPIKTSFNKDSNLVSIEIGNIDPKKEEKAYLLPIPALQERTDNTKLNEVLDKLVLLYNSINNRKSPRNKKSAKDEQLTALFKAIRSIQTRQDLNPTLEQLKVLSVNAEFVTETLNDVIEKSPSLTDEEINRQSENILKIKEELSLMKELDVYLDDYIVSDNTEENNKFKSDVREAVNKIRVSYDKLNKVSGKWVDKYVAQRYGVKNILDPEVSVSTSIASVDNFRTLDKIQLRAAQVLNKLFQNTFIKAESELQKVSKEFKDIYDEVKKITDPKEVSNILLKKENEKVVNKLIDQYNYKKFQKQLNKAIKNKDLEWIKSNIDLDALKIDVEEYKKNQEQLINSYIYSSDIEENKQRKQEELDKLIAFTDLSKPNIYYSSFVRRHPNNSWFTDDYKKLLTNKPVLRLYNFIRYWNNEAAKTGYIDYYDKYNFLPFVRKGLLDKLFDGEFNITNNILNTVTVDAATIGMGARNPLTGERENILPKYYTAEVEDFSEDIFSNIGLFINQVINYKYKSEVEDNVNLILDTEKNKSSLQSINGQVTGTTIPTNIDNTKLIENYIKAVWYDQNYLDDNKTLNLLAKTINKKLNSNLLPTDLQNERNLSITKTMDSANRWFRLKTLGLRIPTSIATFMGGNAQATINAGIYYTASEFWKAEWDVFGARIFKNDKFNLQLMEKFLPVDEKLMEEIRRIAGNKLNKYSLSQILMTFMREADQIVSYANFLAFMQNSIVIDNNIYNAREYYRKSNEYKNRYSLPVSERIQLEKNFEKNVKALLDKYKISEDNLDSINEESLNKYKNLIRNVSKRNTGSMTKGDMMQVNMTSITRSFMMFKSWIPDQLDQRYGELKYNSSTEAFEYGRMRTFMKVILTNYKKSLASILHVSKGNEKGLDILESLWEEKKEQYKKKTGKDLEDDLSKDEFFDLIRNNINTAFKELAILSSLLSLFIAGKLMPPDDDSDDELKNFYKFTIRILDKIKGEVSFYYNPLEFQNFVNQNLFPSLGILLDVQRAISNFAQYVFGIVTENNELVDDSHPLKYTMKVFPISNAAVETLPIFAPEWSKEAGIQLKENVIR